MVSGTTSLDLWPLDQRPQKVVRVRNVDEWLEAVAAGRGVGLSAASTGLMYTHPQIVYRYRDDGDTELGAESRPTIAEAVGRSAARPLTAPTEGPYLP